MLAHRQDACVRHRSSLLILFLVAALLTEGCSGDDDAPIAHDEPGSGATITSSTTQDSSAQTVASTSTTTSTAAPQRAPDCPPSTFELELTTDRSHYEQGEVVTIHTRQRNGAGYDCYSRITSNTFEIRSESGNVVHGSATMTGRAADDPPWQAGATHEYDFHWDQQMYRGEDQPTDQVPPGRYTISSTWKTDDGFSREWTVDVEIVES